jgi:hypothetical protein
MATIRSAFMNPDPSEDNSGSWLADNPHSLGKELENRRRQVSPNRAASAARKSKFRLSLRRSERRWPIAGRLDQRPTGRTCIEVPRSLIGCKDCGAFIGFMNSAESTRKAALSAPYGAKDWAAVGTVWLNSSEGNAPDPALSEWRDRSDS